jgi:predicted Rossmann-fold nucleotide-binding protein
VIVFPTLRVADRRQQSLVGAPQRSVRGIHAKPCGVLDVDGYFAPLRMMVDQMVEEEFLYEPSQGIAHFRLDHRGRAVRLAEFSCAAC